MDRVDQRPAELIQKRRQLNHIVQTQRPRPL
jgi:hypothetical protein